MTNQFENDPPCDDDRPSKSQKKRDMHALQELGEALVALSADRLTKVPLPDRLRNAVDECRRITKHEARRRQLQFIGKLMRTVDEEPIRLALDVLSGTSKAEVARQHRLERLRERLLEDEGVLGEIATAYPGADLQHLRNLRRNAVKEREGARPPRSFREIFRILRDLDIGDLAAGADETGEIDDLDEDGEDA